MLQPGQAISVEASARRYKVTGICHHLLSALRFGLGDAVEVQLSHKPHAGEWGHGVSLSIGAHWEQAGNVRAAAWLGRRGLPQTWVAGGGRPELRESHSLGHS